MLQNCNGFLPCLFFAVCFDLHFLTSKKLALRWLHTLIMCRVTKRKDTHELANKYKYKYKYNNNSISQFPFLFSAFLPPSCMPADFARAAFLLFFYACIFTPPFSKFWEFKPLHHQKTRNPLILKVFPFPKIKKTKKAQHPQKRQSIDFKRVFFKNFGNCNK